MSATTTSAQLMTHQEVLGKMRQLVQYSVRARTVQDYRLIHRTLVELREVLYQKFRDTANFVVGEPDRELIDLEAFEDRVRREASSGLVSKLYAEMVLREVSSRRRLSHESESAIRNLGQIVIDERTYPAKRLVVRTNSLLADVRALRGFLRAETRRKERIGARLGERIGEVFERLGFIPGGVVLVYGYSKTVADVLDRIPSDQRNEVTILVASCSARFGYDMPTQLMKRAVELGFKAELIPDIQLVMELRPSPGFPANYKPRIDSVVMGCKILASPEGKRLSVVATHGSEAVALLASTWHLPVFVVAGSYKIWGRAEYRNEIELILNERRRLLAPSLELGMEVAIAEVRASDIISGESLTGVLTEHGLFPPDRLVTRYSQRFEQNT